MKKEFITPEMQRDAALKLVYKMHKEDGFIPDIIYISLRGGVYMGNVFSEYYKLIRKQADERPVFYAAVVARSYENMKMESEVRIDGWTYSPEHLRTGDKILIVDDIFDTGKTVNALVNVMLSKGIPRNDIKVAVYDYKVIHYKDAEPLP
ncbi:MAG: phosphoribosyltransferase, partial [Sphaerochaetaceae bacterium]